MTDFTRSGAPRYERLEAWQNAHQLALFIYHVTRHFPESELYGLTSQLRRAATSISMNLAEGSMRSGKAEYRRFVGISLSSLGEVEYATRLCAELGLVSKEELAEFEPIRARTGKLLWGLYRSLGGVRAPRISYTRHMPEDPDVLTP